MREISFEDIRVGDNIRIVDAREIKVTVGGSGVRIAGRDEVSRGTAYYMPDSPRVNTRRRFYLLERSETPLPSKPGSVIEVTTAHSGPTRLMALESSSPNGERWQTPNGVRYMDSEVRAIAKNGEIKVIA